MGDAMTLETKGEIIRWTGQSCVEICHASFWRVAQSVGLLVVDEIGTGSEKIKEWRNEMFWKLLEVRKHVPTILTGNIAPLELGSHFDERIYSRICEGQIIQVVGEDQRKKGLDKRVK